MSRRHIQAFIGIVTGVGMAAVITNAIVTGRDVPGGVVTLLMSGIGAVYGIELLGRGK